MEIPFFALEKFGFKANFVSWIRLLYSSPQASVRTNNTQSDYFHVFRSTRQGCPFSLLLFSTAIKPLAIALRASPLISGIFRHNVELKVSLCADDLLLCVSDLPVSVPAALPTFQSFDQILGYKLNLSKSEIIPFNVVPSVYPLKNFPFKITCHSFTYLGIQITFDFDHFYKANFVPLLSRIRGDCERWSVLNSSLVAWINCVKINILPWFSYLFQCIPLFLSHPSSARWTA